MRIASPLVAFIFLGLAAAAAVPIISTRSGAMGSQTASLSGVHSHHSGTPTGASLHGTPSLIPSHSPAARRYFFNSTVLHSTIPSSQVPSGTPDQASSYAPARRAQPTEGYSLQSGSHSMASDHPTPSAGAQSHSHGAHSSGAVGSHTHTGASVLPTPSAGAQSHSHGAHSSGAVGSYTQSGASVLPTPTITQA